MKIPKSNKKYLSKRLIKDFAAYRTLNFSLDKKLANVILQTALKNQENWKNRKSSDLSSINIFAIHPSILNMNYHVTKTTEKIDL